jgi:hypothetical protein
MTPPLAELTGLLPIILIAAAVIGVMAATARPKTLFEIQIVDGQPSVGSGDPPAAFVEDVERICQLWQIDSGAIRGVAAGQGVDLLVKGNAARQTQAFVNAWRNPI